MKQLLAILGLCTGLLFTATPAMAQGGECSNGLCGTPNQSGGGCGCGCGSILIAMTDRGDTYQFADDFDGDGLEDEYDNCPFAFNYEQADNDGDGSGDACDVCAGSADPFQEDLDGDRIGDACDTDRDGDGVDNGADNCAGMPNLAQANFDMDVEGDACDLNDDNDGLDDVDDDCRLGDIGLGACDDDEDSDEIFGADDNCPSVFNPDQGNVDFGMTSGDTMGDACDMDVDADGLENWSDNCRGVANPNQFDADNDGLGDEGMWPGAESCDPSECYVVAGDSQGCLNPRLAFTVRLGLVRETLDAPELMTGDQVIVPLFSNKVTAAHTWEARFAEVPDGSEAIIKNARGSGTGLTRQVGNRQVPTAQIANCISGQSVACEAYNTISFEPDVAGRYVIQVTAELPNGDALGNVATATIVADVGGEKAGGCSNSGAGGMLAALALGLLAMVRRKK